MNVLAHSDWPKTLYRYGGKDWTTSPPGLGDYARSATETVEVVPVEQLRGAVEERRVLDHALTLALKGRVRDVSAAKDALIKLAGDDHARGQSK